MTDLILVRVNCPSKDFAERLATEAVREKLAACANITGPAATIYEWDGEIEKGEEWVLWLKTYRALWETLEAFIDARHPHKAPALLAIPCVLANSAYEDWLMTYLSK